MTENPDAALSAQLLRAMAQARGLERVYTLYPEAVVAAAARGAASLCPLPADFSSITEPAATFDAAGFGGGE